MIHFFIFKISSSLLLIREALSILFINLWNELKHFIFFISKILLNIWVYHFSFIFIKNWQEILWKPFKYFILPLYLLHQKQWFNIESHLILIWTYVNNVFSSFVFWHVVSKLLFISINILLRCPYILRKYIHFLFHIAFSHSHIICRIHRNVIFINSFLYNWFVNNFIWVYRNLIFLVFWTVIFWGFFRLYFFTKFFNTWYFIFLLSFKDFTSEWFLKFISLIRWNCWPKLMNNLWTGSQRNLNLCLYFLYWFLKHLWNHLTTDLGLARNFLFIWICFNEKL